MSAGPLPTAAPPIRGRSGSRLMAWLVSRLASPSAYAIGAPVLCLLSAGTALAAPGLLGPVAFGHFALLTSLVQMVGRGDLGLSQLADRDLCRPDARPGRAGEILRARRHVALALALVLGPALCGAAWWSGSIAPRDVALALVTGIAGVMVGGPVSVMRARRQVAGFTAAALAVQAGLTAPRLLGLLVGGVTGSFAVMAAWMTAIAVLLPRTAAPSGGTGTLPLLRDALPLFAFSALWLVYLLCNRWIAAWLCAPAEFGLFAFGANLAFTAVMLIGAVAQVRYPALLNGIAAGEAGARDGRIEREAALLGLALALAVAGVAPLAPALMGWLFPSYVAGLEAAMVLAVSCVALGVAAWFVPVAVALARRPIREAARVLAPAFAILGGGMALGDRAAGIEGQAWGCVAGSLALLCGLAAALARLGLLPRSRAVRLGAIATVQVALAAAAVIAFAPARAAEAPGAGWTVAFEDRFERLDLRSGETGTWLPHYRNGARWNTDSREMQYYVDPRPGRDPDALRALDPFRIGSTGKGDLVAGDRGAGDLGAGDRGAGLTIVAREIPPEARAAAMGRSYASGMLTTAPSFRFTYGYVEIEARIPRGRGLWPAFWLLPAAGGWPPEIDVLEVLGDDTAGYWATLHTGPAARRREVQARVPARDLSEDVHAYGVLWNADEVAWYLDGRRVFAAPTPADMHGPMYLLLNLAVGGRWPGPPDAATPFPAEMQVRRVRVLTPPDPAGPRQDARQDVRQDARQDPRRDPRPDARTDGSPR